MKNKAVLPEERKKLCKSCENYFIPTGQCKKCLCFIALKIKFKNEKCPIGKW